MATFLLDLSHPGFLRCCLRSRFYKKNICRLIAVCVWPVLKLGGLSAAPNELNIESKVKTLTGRQDQNKPQHDIHPSQYKPTPRRSTPSATVKTALKHASRATNSLWLLIDGNCCFTPLQQHSASYCSWPFLACPIFSQAGRRYPPQSPASSDVGQRPSHLEPDTRACRHSSLTSGSTRRTLPLYS